MSYNKHPAVEAYLQTKHNLWSETTIRSVGPRLNNCLEISPKLDPKKIFDGLIKQGQKTYSIQTTLMALRKFEIWHQQTDRVSQFLKDNSFKFRNCYQDKKIRMTDEDFEKALKKADTPAKQNLLVLLGKCGLRKSEALDAMWRDYDPKTATLSVIGKGNKHREIPLLPSWVSREEEGARIVNAPAHVMRVFIESTGFNFHDYRAYFATRIANHPELNIKDAQMLLGHTSLTTTQRYIRVDEEKQRRVLLGW